MPYTCSQLFDLIADIEAYPEFLPWVVAARLVKITPDQWRADLEVGYQKIRFSYGSEIALQKPYRVQVKGSQGPFHSLNNLWILTPLENTQQGNSQTRLDFSIDFEMSSRGLKFLFEPLFQQLVYRMTTAFSQRALHLYGESLPVCLSD